jgi:proteasome lid subunit RPN8/RPN11
MAKLAIEAALSKMLGLSKYDFEKVIVHQSVLENAAEFAKANAPREFAALLSGSVKSRTLYIEGIIYQHFSSNQNSAVMKSLFPVSSAFGSVHSHPSPSGKPSSADLLFFSNNGLFHLIITSPFSTNSFYAYTKSGKPADFYVYDDYSGETIQYSVYAKNKSQKHQLRNI